MPNELEKGLPFVTRKMLAFEGSATFSLIIKSTANGTGNVLIQGFTKEGPFTLTHAPTTDSVIKTESFALPDIPIMLTLVNSNTSARQGDMYVSVSLAINGDIVQELASGYIYNKKSVSWPYQNDKDLRLAGGQISLPSAGATAAGAEALITVPAGQMWRVIGGRATLVTDATAANRRPHFVFGGIFDCFASVDQTASLTRTYSLGKYGGLLDDVDDNDILVPIPHDIWLPAGNTFVTLTTNLQAGDDWGTVFLDVEMYFH